MNPSPLLSFRGITKSFPAVLANDQIDLNIYGGEIHALLGENGAGKSTLMKILYGFYQADAGEILVNGQPVQLRSPHDARGQRIGMVFQDFILIPALTVAENIALFLPDLPFILDSALIAKRIEEISERYSLQVRPEAPVWQLSVGERQKVELLKLLLADARILILDEPTRSLAPHEVVGLFQVLANLRGDGYAVVVITHKMKEVLACADRITVMRRGKIAGTLLGAEATENTLVSLMFGKTVAESPQRRGESPPEEGIPFLELKGVSTQPEGTGMGLREINLTVRPGEIVGVAGVSGNGQRELGDVVLGIEKCARGTKYLGGQDATRWSVAQVRQSGAAFIPEDPLGMAAFPWLSVQENMAMANVSRYARQGGFSLDWNAVRADLQASLKRLGFQIPPFYVPLGTLSGGNIQRMILAREMAHNPRLIIAFYPTRGLDVQSAVAAREVLLTSRDTGAGILLISEDLDELFALADRLVVMLRGEIVATSAPRDITMKEIGYLMTGAKGEGQRVDKMKGLMEIIRHKRVAAVIRFGGLFGLALAVFAVVLLVFGQNPLRAYVDIFRATLGSSYGFSEVLVKMIPLVLTALAVAIPSRIWLINVGGEGQLFIGALFATWGAVNFTHLPAWLMLPWISFLGFLGGGLWASISGFMRAKGWASETISTLLMNYVAILLVSFFVFGPWKDPESANYPQSAPFPDAAILPSFLDSRIHLGALIAIAGLLLFHFVMTRTRWGLEMRAMGINQEAARRNGISTNRYILLLMFIGGGMAGLAGMGEVSAIHGQLRPSLSPGLGYTGFLIAWITMGNPLGIVAAAFMISIITAGGDILQMTHRIPAAAIHILMALVLFVVLARSTGKKGGK